MLKPFIDLLVESLNFFYRYTGNYGWSIILLTVTVRLLLLPLTIKQTKSMIEAPKIQAKIKELQEKYGKDKKKLNEELLKFYQENKVDPFGGCLPLIIQLPIFWALFSILRKGGEIYKVMQQANAGFYWLESLTKAPSEIGFSGLLNSFGLAFPYFLLLILTAVTTYLPTKLISSDPRQERISLIMNVFLLYIAWILPAGLLLYWVTTNALGLIQQYIQMKMVKEES